MVRLAQSLAFSFVAFAWVSAAEPAPITKPANPFLNPNADRLLSFKVSSAIANDPEFAQSPILVDVLNQIAILGGGVPDEETRLKLETLVRKVPGIRDVKNGCWIRQLDDPFKQMVFDRLDGVKPSAETKPATKLPSFLVLPPEPRPSLVDQLATSPEAFPLPAVMFAQSRPIDTRMSAQVTVQRVPEMPSLPRENARTIGSLTELPMPAVSGQPSASNQTIPVTKVPTVGVSLSDQLAKIQLTQSRWNRIKWRIDGDRVFLSGPGISSVDLWAFAEAIRLLKGIERIIVVSS